MSGLKKQAKKGAKFFQKNSLGLIGLLPEQKKAEPEPVIPLPDEELIEQERRRKDLRRLSSGRQSTILSDGLG